MSDDKPSIAVRVLKWLADALFDHGLVHQGECPIRIRVRRATETLEPTPHASDGRLAIADMDSALVSEILGKTCDR